MKRHRAEAPGEQQRERTEQQRAADAVEQPDRAATDPQSDGGAHPLQPDREEGPEQDPAGDREQRRVLGLRAAGQQLRADPGSDCGPADKPGQRERACDQPALIAERRHGGGEEDDADVDEVQLGLGTAEATTFSRVIGGLLTLKREGRNATGRTLED